MSSLRAPLSEYADKSDVDYESGSSELSVAGSRHQQPTSAKLAKALAAVAVVTILALLGAVVALVLREPKTDTPNPNVIYVYVNGSEVPGEWQLREAQRETLKQLGREMDSSRNLSVDPCEDFYQYSCGGWIAATQLGNASSITKGFREAGDVNAYFIRQILGEDWPLITPFFQSCMNTDALNELGAEPIKPWLAMLDPSNNDPIVDDAFFNLGTLRQFVRAPLVLNVNVRGNTSSPRQAIPYLTVGGTTLPSWRSYIGVNETRSTLIAAIAATLQTIGDSTADAQRYAELVVDFETKLVAITQRNQIVRAGEQPRPMSATERVAEALRESKLSAMNGVFSLNEIRSLMPNVPLDSWLSGAGLSQIIQRVNPTFYVADNQSLPLLDLLIQSTNATQLLAYGRWHAVNASAPYLSLSVQSTHALLFAPLLGLDAVVDRYPYCSNLVVNNVPDLFGRYFVERRLPRETRDVARSLITMIKQAFEQNLPSVSWMDDQTRAVALEKARAVAELVGGPENGNWSDYAEVTIKRNTLFDNFYQVSALKIKDEWSLLSRAISRYTFSMNPSIVNAQYSSLANAMVFPAGILQEPFYNFDYPMAVNLGRIGMVMGHELLHGFDNNGRRFDKNGELRQWWDDAVIAAFVNKTQCLIRQYDSIYVQGSRVNGSFTLGENIADNGGIHMAKLALDSYRAELQRHGMDDAVPDATMTKAPLTSDQLFYWAHSQTWCVKATDRAIANQVLTDVHSPGEARVWAPLVNQPEFAAAFNCPVGSRMNPPQEQKCDLY